MSAHLVQPFGQLQGTYVRMFCFIICKDKLNIETVKGTVRVISSDPQDDKQIIYICGFSAKETCKGIEL